MNELSHSLNQLANLTLKALAPELPGAHIGSLHFFSIGRMARKIYAK